MFLPAVISFNGFDDRNSYHEIQIPIPGLTRNQWIEFLKVAACGNPRTVRPGFRLGTFELTVRRLCDLEAMTNPRLIYFEDKLTWDADWQNPKNLRIFQRTPMLQYDLFVNSLNQYNNASEVKEAIGKKVDDKIITTSGALMVAHRAGLPGLVSWVDSDEVRQKFSDNTTSFFDRANGIF